MKLKKKIEKKVKEIIKPKGKFDGIEFDIQIGITHHDNPENAGYLRGEKSMLEKCKKIIGE